MRAIRPLAIVLTIALVASAVPTQAQANEPVVGSDLGLLPGLLPDQLSRQLSMPGFQFRPATIPDLQSHLRLGREQRRVDGSDGHDVRRFHPGKRAYLSAAFAVSSGVLAWLSKREADDSYDRYLGAAGGERQKTQFDRAERYDRLSGAAYVAMEAGILMSVYFTFF
jgi:hypothetical protein